MGGGKLFDNRADGRRVAFRCFFCQHSNECLMFGALVAPIVLLPFHRQMPVIQCVKIRDGGGACDLVRSTK